VSSLWVQCRVHGRAVVLKASTLWVQCRCNAVHTVVLLYSRLARCEFSVGVMLCTRSCCCGCDLIQQRTIVSVSLHTLAVADVISIICHLLCLSVCLSLYASDCTVNWKRVELSTSEPVDLQMMFSFKVKMCEICWSACWYDCIFLVCNFLFPFIFSILHKTTRTHGGTFVAVDVKTYNAVIGSVAAQHAGLDDKWHYILVCVSRFMHIHKWCEKCKNLALQYDDTG